MKRKELQDRQAKYDAFVSSIGQKEAKRYLEARARASEDFPTRGNIRAALAFVTLTALMLVIFLAS
jgi:uncharacterized heparinase superfamily protein